MEEGEPIVRIFRKERNKWLAFTGAVLLLGASAFMQVGASSAPTPVMGCDICWGCPGGYGGISTTGGCVACCVPPA